MTSSVRPSTQSIRMWKGIFFQQESENHQHHQHRCWPVHIDDDEWQNWKVDFDNFEIEWSERRSNGAIYYFTGFRLLHATLQFHRIHATKQMSIMQLIKRFWNNVLRSDKLDVLLMLSFSIPISDSLSQFHARRCAKSTVPLAYILNVWTNTIEYFRKHLVLVWQWKW